MCACVLALCQPPQLMCGLLCAVGAGRVAGGRGHLDKITCVLLLSLFVLAVLWQAVTVICVSVAGVITALMLNNKAIIQENSLCVLTEIATILCTFTTCMLACSSRYVNSSAKFLIVSPPLPSPSPQSARKPLSLSFPHDLSGPKPLALAHTNGLVPQERIYSLAD